MHVNLNIVNRVYIVKDFFMYIFYYTIHYTLLSNILISWINIYS